MKRHSDAIAIQLGACNPSGIAHSIIAACKEMRNEPEHKGTVEICNDPAVRLMVHQLAYLCRVAEIESDLMAYSRLTKQCEDSVQFDSFGDK